MDTLAEPILERDKERGGGIVVTMPTTSDAVAVQNRPAPSGKAEFGRLTSLPACRTGRLLLGIVNTMSRRRALHPAKFGASKSSYYLGKGQ